MDFVDTNVLLYAVAGAPNERAKADAASAILEDRDVAVSVQVLQEFYTQATSTKHADPLTREEARSFIEPFLLGPVQDVTLGIFFAALATRTRFQISYRDAAILEAARALGCSTVLSEDLNDGQDYGGVRVENPFRGL